MVNTYKTLLGANRDKNEGGSVMLNHIPIGITKVFSCPSTSVEKTPKEVQIKQALTKSMTLHIIKFHILKLYYNANLDNHPTSSYSAIWGHGMTFKWRRWGGLLRTYQVCYNHGAR